MYSKLPKNIPTFLHSKARQNLPKNGIFKYENKSAGNPGSNQTVSWRGVSFSVEDNKDELQL
jgi:hypothetical protein